MDHVVENPVSNEQGGDQPHQEQPRPEEQQGLDQQQQQQEQQQPPPPQAQDEVTSLPKEEVHSQEQPPPLEVQGASPPQPVDAHIEEPPPQDQQQQQQQQQQPLVDQALQQEQQPQPPPAVVEAPTGESHEVPTPPAPPPQEALLPPAVQETTAPLAPPPEEKPNDLDGAASQERQNKRLDPRKEQELNRLAGNPVEPSSTPGPVGSGIGDRFGGYALPESEDDYYGLRESPRDSVDPNSFQPSHILAFEIAPSSSMEFFQDIDASDMRKVVRGDWFVTSGDMPNAQVSIVGPDGENLYSEGPFRTNERSRTAEAASEGSFRFRLFRMGEYKVTITNPSSTSPRTVTFSWLVGRDVDDAFTARGLTPGRGGKGGGGGGLGAGPDLRNASDLLLDMMGRVSRVHKSLDEVVAWQQFVDVRFARSMNAAGQTSGRVQWWTLLESAVIILLAVAQTYMIQSFEVKGHYYKFGGGGEKGLANGAGAGRLYGGGGGGGGGGGAGGRGVLGDSYHKV